MYLKKIELNGFKSFAKRTIFEFSFPITAIVGPNGSGKSNCAEAIRWVLGEQSIKTLRGKRGEDLIFSGTQTMPRMSKASVSLFFDNAGHQLPLEFEEVVVGREVYRDGANEYMINGSKVRLKDIVELLAHVGVGPSQHHIISQGEADRILYASLKDRKEMIEDALSLKIYQIKRVEAERKLERTAENMKQVEALRKEIQPHLRFLKNQAAKFQKTKELRKELEEKYALYLSNEAYAIERQEEILRGRKHGPQKDAATFQRERERLILEIEKEGKDDGGKKDDSAFTKIRDELQELQNAISQLLHERGKIDGMIEMAKNVSSADHDDEVISRDDVEEVFAEIENILSSALEEDIIEQIHAFLNEALARMSSFLSRVEPTKVEEKGGMDITRLHAKKKEIDDAFVKMKEKERALALQEKEMGGTLYEYQKKLRNRERLLYEIDSQLNKAKDLLRSLTIEEERLHLRQDEFARERKEAEHYIGSQQPPKALKELPSGELTKMRNDISRLKFKLEDAGGVDETIVKELEEVGSRDEFFEKELKDLEKASAELKDLAGNLSEKLEREFEKGIAKINREFQKHFEIIFGGGKAELRIVKLETEEGEEEEYKGRGRKPKEFRSGIDVCVSLPRKRIRGLDMLSGGERALTSITLLFALASVNPPPFLVLDEIDAALDENNSRRYGQMLRDLSKETQLIIITHNRESMHNANVLYGVTMGSEGISKILSLKLEEAVEYSK
ncbi:MAG: AAA family ATPase [Candidatus Niyogibacteria bacterium]|nr:AAA family ATPase [Candidatus Niyogibacteria bacterium]